MNWDFYEDTLVRLFESAIDREIETLQQERETSMNTNETSFKVGDRVHLNGGWGENRGTVTDVNMYRIKWDDGDVTYELGTELQYAKLSEEDAWLEVALMVGRLVSEWRNPRDEREIRHRAYPILGGNGVKVTEEVKARVRSLIERAKRV